MTTEPTGTEELKTRREIHRAALRRGFNNVDPMPLKSWFAGGARTGLFSEAVAEHAIGMMMTLNRRIHCAINAPATNFSLEGPPAFTCTENRWRHWYR